MNPSNDTFISTSKDNTTRVWDLYNKKLLVVFDKSKAATFDNSGAVLVIVQSKEVGSKVFNYLNLFGTKEYNEVFIISLNNHFY
jgi:WD40 repeat protein